MEAQIEDYLGGLKTVLDDLSLTAISDVAYQLHEARKERRQIFVLGNGGSAATASHIVCDLAKNTRFAGMLPFRIHELVDNSAVFSAYANDEGYENAMAQHLANFVEKDDIIIAISTSGNSENVIRAVELGKRCGAFVIGFTGFDGGQLMANVDLNLHVRSHCIEHVEDVHLVIGHILTSVLRSMAHGSES